MQQTSKKTTAAVVLNVLILTALLCFIFGNSLFDRSESSEWSGSVFAFLSGLLGRLFDYHGLTEHIVRKLAHFSEFAALGFFTQQLWALRRCLNPHYVLHGLFFGLAVATTDEALQMLSDRSAQVSDVLLDFSGFVFGSLFFLALFLLIRACRR
ncbi:MAG TPA: VanZ family protein [Clostridiales bacterium]|nr:VanZ family protein [Clostridiales bacterium]